MDQEGNDLNKPKRVYLRISANIPAFIFSKGKFFKKVFINDLSATGVCFFMEGLNLPGNAFEFRFRLGFFSPWIKTQVVVRNNVPINGGLRVGCSFEKILLADQKSINRYLCRYTDYYSSYQAVNLVAFFCLIDFALRSGLWAILASFEIIKMGHPLIPVLLPKMSFIFYMLYGLFSLGAFILSDRAFVKKGIRFLGFSLICLTPPFIFVLAKNIEYWNQKLFISTLEGANLFLWIYAVLLVFIGITLTNCLLSFKKASVNIANERAHRARI